MALTFSIASGQGVSSAGYLSELNRVLILQVPSMTNPGLTRLEFAETRSAGGSAGPFGMIWPISAASAFVWGGAGPGYGQEIWPPTPWVRVTVANSTVDDLSKEATAFRDKRLVRFERSDVSGIDIVSGPVRHAFARNQAGWSVDGRAVLASTADDLMTSLSDVASQSFLDDPTARALSERPAEWTITVKFTKGPGWTVKLLPFRGDFAATVANRPGAFLVAKDAADRLRESIEKAAAPPVTSAPATPKPTR